MKKVLKTIVSVVLGLLALLFLISIPAQKSVSGGIFIFLLSVALIFVIYRLNFAKGASFQDIFNASKFKQEAEAAEERAVAAENKLQEFQVTLTPDEKELLSISERLKNLKQAAIEKEASIQQSEGSLATLGEQIESKKAKLTELSSLIEQATEEFNNVGIALEYGLYRPQFRFASSTDFKDELKKTRELERNEIKKLDEEVKKSQFTLNGNVAKGRRMVQNVAKLIMRAYNNEVDEIVNKVKTTNATASIDKIHTRAKSLNKLCEWAQVSIPDSYVALKEKELRLAHEYAKFKEEEAEAIREARYQEREERKLQQEIAAKRRLLEKEQKQYYQALQDAIAQYEAAQSDEEKSAINAKLEELRTKVDDVDKAMRDVDYRQANQKAGYVYIISNIGSFGDNVYKIGMTRRLEPMDRIRELSDASVPFNFDVHALIFCDDAPALEAALHREFEAKKVNLVNQRREFFNVTLEEIEDVVKRNFDKTVDFIEVPDAEQYFESQKMRELGITNQQ